MTRRPERTWNDPLMPDESLPIFKKIASCFTKRGIAISLVFIWTLWAIFMVREWVVWGDVTPLLLAQTFIPITVYAILISPITEWRWNLMTGRKS